VERRSWAPQVPVAAKTRAWTMGGFTIEYWDFTEIFMVKYDIKYGKMMNSQGSIFVIELIQSQVTAFFVGFVIQRPFLMSSQPRSVGTTSSNETCLYGRYSS
jgi:hypothetical protein